MRSPFLCGARSGPSRRSVITATTHATRAKIARALSPFAMKNANGSTRSRRTAVSALAIAPLLGPLTPHNAKHTLEITLG